MIDPEIKKAMQHSDKLGEGAKKRKKLTPNQRAEAVMREFARGTLYSGNGKKVTDINQAKAIAISESKKKPKKK